MYGKGKLVFITNKPYKDCESFIQVQIDSFDGCLHFHLFRGLLADTKKRSCLSRLFLAIIRFFRVSNSVYNRLFLKLINSKVVVSEYGNVGAVVFSFIPNGCEHIIHFHGHDAVRKAILEKYHQAYKQMFNDAYAIISVSAVMSERLKILGASQHKLVENPYGPRELFASNIPEYNSNRFLFVGRLVEKKAPHLLILAFERVAKYFPKAELIIIGDGPLKDSCQIMITALHLSEQVHLKGRQDVQYIKDEMEGALAYVQHSITAPDGDMEGTPVSILEATLAGLPIISTRHAGIQEVVLDKETGFLVDELDIDSMANRMIKLLEDRSLAKQMGLAGRRRTIEYYSINRHLDKLHDVVNSGFAKNSN